MRLFTGIALPPEVSAPLLEAVRRWKPLAHLSWTREDKLHITVKFIGDWPEARLPELEQALAGVHLSQPVAIRLEGSDWLPNARTPHSLCLSVHPHPALLELASATEAALEPLGLLPEPRLYRPHLTLGRIRKKDREPLGPLRAAVEHARLHLPAFHAASFHLYLSAEGNYTRLSEYPLPSA